MMRFSSACEGPQLEGSAQAAGGARVHETTKTATRSSTPRSGGSYHVGSVGQASSTTTLGAVERQGATCACRVAV